MFGTIEIKDVKRELGELVKVVRKQNKLSQSDLSASLDMSRTTIQNLESGKNFTVDTFLKVIKEFDLLDQLHTQVLQARDQQSATTKSLY